MLGGFGCHVACRLYFGKFCCSKLHAVFMAKRLSSEVDNKSSKLKKRNLDSSEHDTSVLNKYNLHWIASGGDIKPGLSNTYILSGSSGSELWAAFDLDWTIIKPSSGAKWPQSASDWTWLFPSSVVPAKLAEVVADGYRLVFITNQGGIEKGKAKLIDIQRKVELIIGALELPILCLIVTGQNHFRKPAIAGWDLLVKNHNNHIPVDTSRSFYVGDAAGRAVNYVAGRKKDFSCSDRQFAANLGLEFKTPEEFFLNEKTAPFSWRSVDPKSIIETFGKNCLNPSYHSDDIELVILVGLPASGKSTFAERFFVSKGYVRVNRDTLGTVDRCRKSVEAALNAGQSVVLDNTNPQVNDRAPYIKLAQQKNVPCRCFLLKTPKDVAQHLNFVRVTQTAGATRRIPMVAYNTFKSRMQEPSLQEGFSEVVCIPFVPHFERPHDRETFSMWTSDGN